MFENLKLSEEILRAVEDKGFTVPTEIQSKCIPLIMSGSDVVGRSKTGSGKTLAFGVPLVEHITEDEFVQAVVVCPTRELAMQVADELRTFAKFKQIAKPVCVYGGSDMKKQIIALKKARVVVATPGRLKDHLNRRTVNLSKVSYAVLDEADEMLNMGFREDIESILKATPKSRQTVMFSATMPHTIKQLMRGYMKQPEFVEIGEENTTLKEIAQSYIMCPPNGKKSAIKELFETDPPRSAIVFCNTKAMVDDVNAFLIKNNVKSVALHGDMPQGTRRRVIDGVKNGSSPVLVATDVAARGLDIDDVACVINYDLPIDLESYIHRIGRTGRAGKSGLAIAILNNKDQLNKIRYFKNVTKSELTEHPLSKEMPAIFDLKLKKARSRRSW